MHRFSVLALALLAMAPAAHAGPTSWTTFGSIVETSLVQADLARTSDGVLHAIWYGPNADSSKDVAFSMNIAADGTTPTATTPIGTWDGLQNPAIAAHPNGLVAYLPGLLGGRYGQGALATAPLAGSPWTLSQGDVVSTEGAPYVNDGGLTIGADGVLYQSGGSVVHRGVSKDTPNYGYQSTIGGGCCAYDSSLATDGATGQVWLAWQSNASNNFGLYVHEVDTATGAPKGAPMRMPSSVIEYEGRLETDLTGDRSQIAARPGLPGVWTAFPKGYPSADLLAVWKVGDPTDTVISSVRLRDVETVALTSDATGRLWAVWSARNESGKRNFYVKRSNTTVTRWSGAGEYAPPSKTQTIWTVAADSAGDSVDVVANIKREGGDERLYHRRMLAGVNFTSSPKQIEYRAQNKKKSVNVNWLVSTELGPIAGATVQVDGKTGITDQNGRVAIAVGPLKKDARFVAKAGASGYATTRWVFKVVPAG